MTDIRPFLLAGGEGLAGCSGCCGMDQPWPDRYGYLSLGYRCDCTDAEAASACPIAPLPPENGSGGVNDVAPCW